MAEKRYDNEPMYMFRLPYTSGGKGSGEPKVYSYLGI